MAWYKIVDKDKNGDYRALFHGVSGSRFLPPGAMIESEQKIVSDGTNGTKYTSGWHVMNNLDECKEYMSKFTATDRERVIVEVGVYGRVWPKKHSPSNVYLCETIKILREV